MFVRVRDGDLQAWSARQCAGAVEALAAVLPSATHAIQCCTDTLELALGTLAAWRAGQTVVMPSTRLAADVERLRLGFADSYVLDGAAFADAVRAAAASRAANASGKDAATTLLAASPPAWPAFALDPAHPAIVLFTSGTTREPRAQAKTWDALVRGAETFRRAFPHAVAQPLLAGTVDCHHMFGLEANFMASIHCGYPLCTDRPQLPADLAALLASGASARFGPLWLVTTPLQLSAFLRARGVAVEGIERVIVATMPLPQSLAVDVEAAWHTRVDEIYGNTECGVMATRRTATQRAFTPAPGVVFQFREGAGASVTRIPGAAVELDDRIVAVAGGDGAFELLGRRSDMVKVAGKRTTLRALDDHLLDIAGVDDGAFLQQDDDGRVSAVVVAPAHTPASLRAELARRVDPAFMPRPLLFAATLPRDPQGKLPRDTLLRIAAGLARAAAQRARTITRDRVFPASHPAFAGHFPGHPVVPGAMLLAEVDDLLESHGYRVRGCDAAKFMAPIGPGELCTIRVDCADPRRVVFDIGVADRACVRGVFACESPASVAAAGEVA